MTYLDIVVDADNGTYCELSRVLTEAFYNCFRDAIWISADLLQDISNTLLNYKIISLSLSLIEFLQVYI